MIIAIDGPAGAGKSTVAREVARALGLFFLDTGAMYRAVTLEVLERGGDPRSERDCARVAQGLGLSFDARGHISIDGRPGEPGIRSERVTAAVSAVSAHPEVRSVIVREQRALAERAERQGGLVAEGRDTTTVVFPRAEHKFFLIASSAERARRRARELGDLAHVAQIQADIDRRDALDSERAHSPLVRAPDATVLETDSLEAVEVARRILEHVRAASPLQSRGDPRS